MFTSFRDIIALWPTMVVLADEISVPHSIVLKWKQNDTIPAKYWQRIISSALKRGHALTAEDFARVAAREAA